VRFHVYRSIRTETMDADPYGQKALVTGGSRGIGAGIVRKLAEHGADVAFTYKSNSAAATEVTKDIEAGGRRALAIEADSSGPGRLEDAVTQAAAALISSSAAPARCCSSRLTNSP
jgi:NAD(P)-dependent dehydrogenase (short-subunit alcohol dehydrogenase family)